MEILRFAYNVSDGLLCDADLQLQSGAGQAYSAASATNANNTHQGA
jgi:hypothetical protein